MKALALSVWDKILHDCEIFGDKEVLNKVFELSVDSRIAHQGQLFVAIKGEKVDGHNYITNAYEKGVKAFLCHQDNKGVLQTLVNSFSDAMFIFSNNPLLIMALVARSHLDRLNLTRLGITGSSGKTTTKEMLAAVLNLDTPTFYTPGNLNSEIGLPIAALDADENQKWGIFEAGVNRIGEMDNLALAVQPFLTVLTNIGSAHIGIFGSREGIALEKKKLFLYQGKDSHAILPDDCDLLDVLKKDYTGHVHLFGFLDPDFKYQEDLGLNGHIFSWKGKKIHLPLPGKYNVKNALSICKACNILGIQDATLIQGLESIKPTAGRLEIRKGRINLIVDCYNANLDSMKGLIETVNNLENDGRKILILGSMKELGDHSINIHKTIGTLIAQTHIEAIFLFGLEMEITFNTSKAQGYSGNLEWTEDFEMLKNMVSNFVHDGDLVALKASRSLELERLIPLWFPSEKERM